jgi:hypothetical protein
LELEDNLYPVATPLEIEILSRIYFLYNFSHVLLNWQFEGSNDRENWECLDKRIYNPPEGVNDYEVQ